jgi:sulfur carrier protein
MRVTANGREVHLEGGTTVEGFLRARGLDPGFVIVERNGEALERGRYGDTLAEGDRLEVVGAVAGG